MIIYGEVLALTEEEFRAFMRKMCTTPPPRTCAVLQTKWHKDDLFEGYLDKPAPKGDKTE